MATVSQQMDEEGQLVVRIESIDVNQKVADTVEVPSPEEGSSYEVPVVKSETADAANVTSLISKKKTNHHFAHLLF